MHNSKVITPPYHPAITHTPSSLTPIIARQYGPPTVHPPPRYRHTRASGEPITTAATPAAPPLSRTMGSWSPRTGQRTGGGWRGHVPIWANTYGSGWGYRVKNGTYYMTVDITWADSIHIQHSDGTDN